MLNPALTPEVVLGTLRTVKYPGFSRDIVSFGAVKDVRLDGANVSLDLQIPTQDAEVIAVDRAVSNPYTC